MNQAAGESNPRARTDRAFRVWYLSERRRDRIAGGGAGSASARLTEDGQERETEDGQLREIET